MGRTPVFTKCAKLNSPSCELGRITSQSRSFPELSSLR